jgi:polyferredoxin
LVVLGVLLLTLVAILSWQPVFAPNPKRLRRVRLTYLVFTLCFIGWYAQGQLSIVHLTGAIKSLRDGQGLSSYLYDPVALVLIAFTLPTFFVWGRGTFCGWLCPFGALQEFVDLAARKLRAPRLRVSKGWDRLLAGIPFAVLCVLILAAAFAPDKAARLVEIEPFKTAITLGFDRSWPFVAYALALLTAGAFIYKFFCRYLCPLGAFMKVSGKLRRFDWLARRVECGRPCQTCRYRCQYDAIASDGAIKYDDCFQCLDCVAINNDDQSCAADLLLTRKGRTMRSRSAPITVTPPKTDSGKVAGSPSGTTAY